MSTRTIVLAALFAALTAVGAQFAVPNPLLSVPITLQTLFVLITGMVLGPRTGAVSLVVYLVMGLLNLPVFAGFTGGFAVLAGRSGGYIIGFIPAAFIVGLIAGRGKKVSAGRSIMATLVGTLVIHLFGVPWFYMVTKVPVPGILVGSLPYLPGDLFKAVVAAYAGREIRRLAPLKGVPGIEA